MKNIVIKTIRVTGVIGAAFFALVNSAYAQPILTPVSVTHVTDTGATLVGKVSNPNRDSTVWFEWSVGPYLNYSPTTVAVQTLYDGGSGASFEWNLKDLVPGQTYSYRAVAIDGGMTTYSQVSSFVAKNPNTNNPVSTTYQSTNTPIQTPAQTVVSKSQTTSSQTQTQTQIVKTVVVPVKVVKTVEIPATTDGFTNDNTSANTNANSAAVIGTGNDMFPRTLIGWLALIIAILAMVLVAHMIYDAPEKKKRDLEAKKKKEEENKHKLTFRTV